MQGFSIPEMASLPQIGTSRCSRSRVSRASSKNAVLFRLCRVDQRTSQSQCWEELSFTYGPRLLRYFLPDPRLFASAIGMLANSDPRGSGSPYGLRGTVRGSGEFWRLIFIVAWRKLFAAFNFRRSGYRRKFPDLRYPRELGISPGILTHPGILKAVWQNNIQHKLLQGLHIQHAIPPTLGVQHLEGFPFHSTFTPRELLQEIKHSRVWKYTVWQTLLKLHPCCVACTLNIYLCNGCCRVHVGVTREANNIRLLEDNNDTPI